MQIHGLRFETQASVQVNNSGWMPISDSTVTLLGNARAYGGIGGGFSTLKMTMNLPAGSVQTGTNTISFRFNQTDGRVSGFRVLAFNVQAADGSQLIPASTFVYDDPNSWQPPSSSASDIAAGQTLWHQAPVDSSSHHRRNQADFGPLFGLPRDGRAGSEVLQLFQQFDSGAGLVPWAHGAAGPADRQLHSHLERGESRPAVESALSARSGIGFPAGEQLGGGRRIGRGAGLRSGGLDQQMLAAMFPSGIQDSVFAATSRLNQRELPLPVQLPDWNQWLPGTHPMDAFGSTFTSNGYNTIYQTLSSNLQVKNPAVYVKQRANFGAWFSAFYRLYNQVGAPIWNNPQGWTPALTDAMYSLPQWGMVKTWELNNQFQLEGFSQNIFGPNADPARLVQQLCRSLWPRTN